VIKKIIGSDNFSKNIAIVFAGTTLASFLNLLYQLLIAHQLAAWQFAAFNSLLAIFMLAAAPVSTLQMGIAKYSAKYNALGESSKVSDLLSGLFKKTLLASLFILLLFLLVSPKIISALKIPSMASVYILAFLVSAMYITPVLAGGVQGLEIFRWYAGAVAGAGILKLVLAFVMLLMGYQIAGALGALLASILISLVLFYIPLRKYINFSVSAEQIEYRQIFGFLVPVALANFCFIALVNFDMIWVKYFFTPDDAGLYALAQMIGKIFLFLPGAVSIVMFPRTAGLNARQIETFTTLKRSLFYGFSLCLVALVFYNLFPVLVLKVLTGKTFSYSVTLGRLFSVSMTFFALIYIQIFYFLSIKDLRFLKYLIGLTLLQNLFIYIFHNSLIGIQLILCINGLVLFILGLWLLKRKRE